MEPRRKHSLRHAGLLAFLITFCLVGLTWEPAGPADNARQRGARKDKVSPDLRERLPAASEGGQAVEVVLQLNGKPGGRLNGDGNVTGDAAAWAPHVMANGDNSPGMPVVSEDGTVTY